MNHLNQGLVNHYFKHKLFEDIVHRLEQQGIDLNKVERVNIAGVDEFHVRGAAVSNELASLLDLKNKNVLDIGCGLGGPCRMLADEFDCTCTGLDLNPEYIRTATELSKLVKLDSKTSFVQGDATNLPFDDNSFDVAWTQHVQMNIPDKVKFYSEINRVLKPGGYLLYYDIFKMGDGEISFPMPWASSADQSFLFKTEEMDGILQNLGFAQGQRTDQTKAGIHFFETLVAKLKEHGPPKIGLNVLMGESTKPKLMNLLSHMQGGRLALESGVYQKMEE